MENEEKQPYFRTSTESQRRLLFEEWKRTGKISEACREAKLSRTAFYRWQPRFEEKGYAGFEKPLSHAPHNPVRTEEEIAEQIVRFKQENPDWGRERIADELMKSNNWIPLVSASTVRRILVNKGLMPSKGTEGRKKKN